MITFTGGLILGLVIGAVVVFALGLYILWSPVRELRESCREAEARCEFLEGSIKNAIGWIDGDLRDIIRDVGNQICSYNDLYESADRIEHLLAEALRQQASESEHG